MKSVHELQSFLLFVMMIKSEGITTQRGTISDVTLETKEHSPLFAHGINKRAVLSSTTRGTTALLSILSGAKRTYTKLPHTTRYVKNGNLNSATEEFSSLTQASEIKEFPLKKGKILIRHVGNRQFTLYTVGDKSSRGKPFIQVKSKGYKDVRIVYRDK